MSQIRCLRSKSHFIVSLFCLNRSISVDNNYHKNQKLSSPIGRTDGNLDLDRTDGSPRSRWTGPIGPSETIGPSGTDRIGPVRLGPKSVGLGRVQTEVVHT